MEYMNLRSFAVQLFKTIEIDLDVSKQIEIGRRSFDEADNAILRRLLKIDDPGSLSPTPSIPPQTASGRRPWSGKGVTLPHGTELRMEYNGQVHIGVIEDGRWLIEGKLFNSPSAAAGGVSVTKDGKHPSLDGWEYWHAKVPGEHRWIAILTLRKNAAS